MLAVVRRLLSVLRWLLSIRRRLSLVVVLARTLTVAVVVASGRAVLRWILGHVCFAMMKIPQCCVLLVVLCCD
jgi:hypothetical protein